MDCTSSTSSSILSRTKLLSLICGVIRSVSATSCRCTETPPKPPPAPPRPESALALIPAPCASEARPPRPLLMPETKGMFSPTTISASSLSIVRMCGLESTLTSLSVCTACRMAPKEGRAKPSASRVPSTVGPRRPTASPMSCDGSRKRLEREPTLVAPKTGTSSPPISGSAPLLKAMPNWFCRLTDTSMITAST